MTVSIRPVLRDVDPHPGELLSWVAEEIEDLAGRRLPEVQVPRLVTDDP
jgi:hypothetical protein